MDTGLDWVYIGLGIGLAIGAALGSGAVALLHAHNDSTGFPPFVDSDNSRKLAAL